MIMITESAKGDRLIIAIKKTQTKEVWWHLKVFKLSNDPILQNTAKGGKRKGKQKWKEDNIKELTGMGFNCTRF